MPLNLGIDDALAAAFAAAGEVGVAYLQKDWGETPLGQPVEWPQELRSLISMSLASRFPLLIWWGPDLVMLYNDAYRRIIDRKHPIALGSPGRDVFPEIWDLIGPMLGGVLERGEATWSVDQMLLLHRAGFLEECYFTFSYSPIRDAGDHIAGVFCAVAESTDRVLAERRLRVLSLLGERTAGVSSVAEACSQAVAALTEDEGRIPVPFALIYLLDPDGSPRLVAQAGLRQGMELGAWPAAAANLNRPATFALDSAEFEPERPWREGRRPATAIRLPLTVQGSAEEAIDGLMICGTNPLRQLDEPYLAFFRLAARVAGTAIAAGKRQEEEQRRLELLAELDRAKTDFFSNVSHELRTPLTLLLGPLEDLLASPATSASVREPLEMVHRNALRLTRLVNTLLDFSRIEAGRLEPHFEDVDLAQLTRELASSFIYAADKAGIELFIDCPALAAPVQVDSEMWEKIVLNLLTNALKFTVEGSIRIRLQQQGDQVELQVSDTGPGIPEGQLERVFERFHRVRGSQARTFEGTGIGLSLVRELVLLQGGTVDVSSSRRGTTFTVRLPAARTGVDSVVRAGTPASARVAAEPYIQEALRWLSQEPSPVATSVETRVTDAGKILVVEDNADMRDYLIRLLRPHWSVAWAEDGGKAVAAALADPPDLILTDVMMPGLDGFGLLRALRDNPTTAGVPVVMLSARAGSLSAIEGLEAGADDYLVKPFSGQELVARVRTNIELARRRTDLAKARFEAERLAEVDVVKRQFLLLASHELRTPVTVLRGYLSMLADGTLGQLEQVRAIEQLRWTVGEVHRIVELMLEVARFDETHPELEVRPTELPPLLQRAIFGGALETSDRIDLHASPVWASVDTEKLTFIVHALVDNALRFSDPGTRVIVKCGTAGEDRAAISVTDAGFGIDPEDLPKLFTRFGRLVTGENARLSGIGLSLYLSRELARAQGGDITVESRPGAGSTFTVWLAVEPGRQSVGPEADDEPPV